MCISCGNCSTYCEMGIDVRQYAMENGDVRRASCVGCGMCAQVCPRGVLKLENRPARGPGQPIRVWAVDLNRVRGERPPEEVGPRKHEQEQPPRRRCSPSWARLIARVYQVDPLLCRRCGQRMSIVAFVTDTLAIRRILDHLGLSPPEKPPPEVSELIRVPVDEEGREIGVKPA